MRKNVLLGSAALIFLIGLTQAASIVVKSDEKHVPYEKKGEGTVAVELVVRNEEQGIYYVSPHETVERFLSRLNLGNDPGNRTAIAEGMSIRLDKDRNALVSEMAPCKKIALDIPVDINSLSPSEMMLVPGIGEKTAHAIHLFIQDRGCIRDLSELSEISGIKDRKIEKMRKYFITNPASCARPVPVL
ncbi:MAG TPA: helix-hairpin-helix domain-containing protein [Syntrophales bacterium]|jgi:DNA uptake protein ComE-like DNA-binding protein|nr:helix-hairpin-helix domain-containing protein [Syntrophales bacterium]HPX56144.1 helix-hairpin-helix domain-containing protein [Syntrophales bacterium]HQA82779.1 helix-hairpin-helix domain-containing protein [Syntrophales bacterium]